MNMFDEARGIESMLKAGGITQKKLAEILNVSQPYIANKLRLLHLPSRIQKEITEKGLSERHARTVLRLNEDQMSDAVAKIAEANMTVREAEILVDLLIEEALSVPDDYEGDAQRICRFERMLDASISNLKAQGIGARASTEKYGGKLYISICIG